MNEYPHTKEKINHVVENKEYVLQHTKRGYRCISWCPHNIMTEWVKNENKALLDGDNAINKFYNRELR
jgi:hypothetical protein